MPPPPVLPTDFSRLAILLDIDGTLLDLAPTPRQVFASRALRETLARLSTRTGGALAFVSGRPVVELDLIFAPLQLPAIGGHGAEMRLSPGKSNGKLQPPSLDPRVKQRFASIAQLGPGILLEDKGYSLALHYRLVPEKETLVREKAAEIQASLPSQSIEILPGKLMLEIKPSGFTKGTAVRELMAHAPFAGRRPIFIGDDITDATVFEIMPEFDGVSASVGDVPGATYSFEHPSEVRRWLDQISRNGCNRTS
jgi:trehalose 6-phosphate phosphatase